MIKIIIIKKNKTLNPSSLTFRLSSAASSFFWISSRDGSRRCGIEVLRSGTASKDGGLRITSKAWPDARLFSLITSTSLMTHHPRSTASAALDCGHVWIIYHYVTSYFDSGVSYGLCFTNISNPNPLTAHISHKDWCLLALAIHFSLHDCYCVVA